MDLSSYKIATININTITNETKINALRTFARTLDLDIIFIQEVENERLNLPGYTIISNVDYTRRGTAIALKDYITYSHVEKSLDGRLIALRLNNTTLVNVYAPSGSQLRADRERFYNNTLAFYLRHNTPNIIVGGDFNSVLRPCDATGSNNSPALQTVVRQLKLCDIWEKLHPRSPGHTYITAQSSSRLDRFYISSNLQSHLRSAETHCCAFTDHKAVTVRLCLPNLGREPGRGFWNLRPHLLTAEHIEEFQYRWQFWTRDRRNFPSWITWWVHYAKPKIKSFFRWKSKIAFDDFNREHQRLYNQLQNAYDRYYMDPSVLPTINHVKGKMLALQRNFTQMFVKMNETYIAGEALSTFQIGERRRKRTTITSLRTENNETLNQSADIEEHMLRFFRELYSERMGDGRIEEDFNCDRVVPENDEGNEACMSEITSTEILSAIRASASRKSPGTDGIPKEFYQRTFNIIHRELNLILNEALQGNIPPDFVNGVIVLVKKKDSDNSARSYRPISLLNCDYKILSRILKTRLENVVKTHQILSDSQKCANPNRNIFQATLSLKDRVAHLIQRKQRAKLISFDFENAFDRVRLSFLHRTMESLGINSDLVRLLSRIANLSSSRILINGHLSSPFPIQRSVRQGCPLSMLLFVLYLHPLLQRLERVCGEDLVVAYADDVTVIVSSTQKINDIKHLFLQFEQAAGAKLNLQKTKSVDVGFSDGNPLSVPWLQTSNTVKVLGVIFANSIRQMINLNWDSMVGKFTQLAWFNSTRSLNLHQKVILLNTFLTSKIWYLASIIPPNSVHTAKITATMGTFLWNRIPARIPLQQLARDYAHGGLKLQLPILKCKALMVNRYVQEIDSMPFYKTFLRPENGIRPPTPTNLPDLNIVCREYSLLPMFLQQSPTANQIHRTYVEQTDAPRVERNNPNFNWKRAWLSISSRRLPSSVRSNLFMFVNEKYEHGQLYQRIRRVDTAVCNHCNAAIETLKHKFSECTRVLPAWTTLQRRATVILNGWRRLNFDDFSIPVLQNMNIVTRHRILKLFSLYISFINTSNNRIDVSELEFHLDSES